MYQKEVFEDMQNNGRNLKTFFLFQVHQVPTNQDLQKIWQEEIVTSLTAGTIQFILLQRQKWLERHMIALIQALRHTRCDNLFDDTSMQHHLDSRSSLNVFDNNIAKISHDTQTRYSFTLYAIITKASKIRNC